MNLDERIKYASMKARHKKELRPWYKKPWGIIMIILGSLLLIILSIFSFKLTQILSEKNNLQDESVYFEDMKGGFLEAVNRPSVNTIGSADAPVTIVEFADFSCLFCRDSYASLKNIRQKYVKEVRIVYRDFPLHDNSIFLALSARCAGEQGKFWQMHDLLYENQDRFEVSQSELEIVMPEIGLALGLDENKFQTCIEEQRYFPQIKQDFDDADFLQIQGTPTWYINNVPFTGYLSPSELEELVNGTLKSLTMPKITN